MRIVYALWLRNIKLFLRNRVQLVFTIIMPFFFLYVFSRIFNTDGIEDPVNYMLAGIVITNVFQTSLSIASSTIEDIVSGFMKEVLVSPVKRVQIAAGQLLSSATIATAQGVITLLIGFVIGLRFSNIFTPLAVIAVMAVVGLVFSGLGLFMATIIKNSQTFQIVSAAVTMPFTFLCGAYIPLSILPDALRYAAYFNPMTYATAFFRVVILEKTTLPIPELVHQQLAFPIGNIIISPWLSAFIVLIFGGLFLILSTIAFSRVDFSRINRSKSKEADIWA